jgi:hypothetical protein
MVKIAEVSLKDLVRDIMPSLVVMTGAVALIILIPDFVPSLQGPGPQGLNIVDDG